MSRLAESTNPFTARRDGILVVILLIAFFLRIWLLGAKNVWWDEGLAIWAIRKSWLATTLWTAADVHPPLYFWLLKAWVSLAGESEFAARFPSLICGMLTVAAVYPLGKLLLRPGTALLATALLACSRFHIWWSQEMRMYILATLCAMLSTYALWRWLQAEDIVDARPAMPGLHRLRQAFSYVLASLAGLHTIYLFVVVLAAQSLFVLIRLVQRGLGSHRDFILRWAVSQLAIIALFLPWLAVALPRMRSWSVAKPIGLVTFVQLYFTLLITGISTNVARYTPLVISLGLLPAAGLALALQARGETSKNSTSLASMQGPFFLTLFVCVPPAIVFLLTKPRSLFYSPSVEARYLVLCAPAFCLLLAWAIQQLHCRAKWGGLLSVVAVAAVFAWTLPGHYSGRYLRDELQTMVRTIAAYAEPSDVVLLVSGDRYPIFEYYYGRLPRGATAPPMLGFPQDTPRVARDLVEPQLEVLAANHPRIWLAAVDTNLQDPEGIVQDWLAQHYEPILSSRYDHNSLHLFASRDEHITYNPASLAPLERLAVELGPDSQIVGYDVPTHEYRSGDVVHLVIYYVTAETRDLEVHLLTADGRVLNRQQLTLSPSTTPQRTQLDWPVFAHTPSSPYHFELRDAAGQTLATFGAVKIVAGKPPSGANQPPNARQALFADNIELLGYALSSRHRSSPFSAAPGGALTLDLYWRASDKISRDYTVFAHLVGESYNPATSGPVWAGHDSQPMLGGYPTTQWLVGQSVVDRHVLQLSSLAPPGEYVLEIGLYSLDSMERLAVLSQEADDDLRRVVLAAIVVLGD